MKFAKDEGSSFLHIVIVWVMFAIAIIVTIYVYTMSLTSTVKTQIENDLSVANLSAATIDIQHYTDTGKFVLIDVRKAYSDFIYTFRVNMGLEDKGNNLFDPEIGSYFEGIISNISVINFTVYNIDGNIITVDSYNVGSNVVSSMEYSNKQVFTPDGVNVDSPTVYSQVAVTLTLPGHVTKTVTRENSVAVIFNK